MKFDIFNQRREMLTVSARWNRQYRDSTDGAKLEIGKKLAAIDATKCRPEEINAIIGNESWTSLFCSSCNDYHSRGVSVGEDYPAKVCASCLRVMLAAMEAA